MTLCFTVGNTVRAWECVDDFQHLAAIISVISRLFSVTIREHCVPSWRCIIRIEQRVFLYDTYVKYGYAERVGENLEVNFVMKEFKADEQFTVL
jgi:hypothetical protein